MRCISRSGVIPFVAGAQADTAYGAVLLHLGLYAYRPAALAEYADAPPSALESLEGLEQLRFLEGRAPVRVRVFDPLGWDCIELNNPQDVSAIEAVLRQRGIA